MLRHTVKTALVALKIHTLRSFLTIIGIVIGVAAIIVIMSLGKSAEDLILNQIRGLGSQTIIIGPGREPEGPSNFIEMYTDSLKEKDVELLQKPSLVRGMKRITPIVMQMAPVSFEEEVVRTNILGSSPLLADILQLFVQDGRPFNEEDVQQRRSVAVIGSEVKEDLFGNSDAVNERIRIKGQTFTVVGVLPPRGQVVFFDVDHTIVVPYTTAQKYLLGINYYHSLLAEVEKDALVPLAVSDIEYTLREAHGIDDPEKDDFHVMTQENTTERVKVVTNILTLLLVSVAAISLVVGGIGIMNIMLVSVVERTHEIGLRKSIGATNKDILLQFLAEAVILTALGGALGIILGLLVSYVASFILSNVFSLNWDFQFSLTATLLGLIVSGFVGILFGLYPARLASRKAPIEALRYE